MSFLQSQSEQREISYQRKEKERLKGEIDYALTKWEITPEEHTTRALQIIQGYQSIVGEIMEENLWDA